MDNNQLSYHSWKLPIWYGIIVFDAYVYNIKQFFVLGGDYVDWISQKWYEKFRIEGKAWKGGRNSGRGERRQKQTVNCEAETG